jgi:hypothetical protein
MCIGSGRTAGQGAAPITAEFFGFLDMPKRFDYLIGCDEGPTMNNLLQLFTWEHLPGHLQIISKPSGELGREMAATLPPNAESTTAMRKLLEVKDCAAHAIAFVSAAPRSSADDVGDKFRRMMRRRKCLTPNALLGHTPVKLWPLLVREPTFAPIGSKCTGENICASFHND